MAAITICFMANRWGVNWKSNRLYFIGFQFHMDGDCSHEIKKHLLLGRKAMTNLDSVFKSRDITLPAKVCLVKAMFFSVVMYRYDLDHKEGWELKNWCFWTVVLEKTVKRPLDSKEIKPVNTKGNQLWIFIGSTDTETEALILWLPDANSWLIVKYPDPGKDCWAGEESDRVWDGWMASWIQWTWVWANPRR